jgi:hypothetical protein
LTQHSPPAPLSAGPEPGIDAGFDAGIDAASYGEQCADTDGLAAELCLKNHGADADAIKALLQWGTHERDCHITDLEARIARKDAANEALYTKLEATMADMQSLQRKAANWEAEACRLSALLIEAEAKLAQRRAMPANALLHSR